MQKKSTWVKIIITDGVSKNNASIQHAKDAVKDKVPYLMRSVGGVLISPSYALSP